MYEKVFELVKANPQISCYQVAKTLGKNPSSGWVGRYYWRAKYELLVEQTGQSLETDKPKPTPKAWVSKFDISQF